MKLDPRLSTLLQEAEQRWGRGALMRWGDAIEQAGVEAIPTGFAQLDAALGIGGLPCGRISEIFGADSSGKHALVAHLAVQCQRQEGVVAYVDMARRLDREQMRTQGVDFNSLLVAQPDDYLQGLEAAIRLARSGGVKLLILDLSSGARAGIKPAATAGVWAAATGISLALRRLVAAVDKNSIALLFLSQAVRQNLLTCRTQVNVGQGLVPCGLIPQQPTNPGETSPYRHSAGGQALRYFASVRLGLERKVWIRRGREVVGCRSLVQTVKNKLAPPLRVAEVELLFYRFPPSAPSLQLMAAGASNRVEPQKDDRLALTAL